MAPDLRRLGGRRLNDGGAFALHRDYLLAPSGELLVREVIRHPGSVVVVPWTGSAVALVEQYRHPVGREILELPAGKLDIDGETPEAAASRECIEEVGLAPGSLTRIHRAYASPGYSDEVMHVFLAEDLDEVATDPQGFEERHARIVWLDGTEVSDGLRDGRFEDAKTILGLQSLLRDLP